MKITVFNAKKNDVKRAYSPYDDNTFIFETHESNDNLQLWNVLVSHWVLNMPLGKITAPIRTFRRKENLKNYYSDIVDYFILDIDDVSSETDMLNIIEHFKQYRVILGESKSNNAVDNFNLKGILFIEPLPIEQAKKGIASINLSLKCCTVDEAVARQASLNAPIGKNKILLNNMGELYKCNIQEVNSMIQEISMEYVQEIAKGKPVVGTGETIEELCSSTFHNMGFSAMKLNENHSITYKHPSEIKSPGGYFWFKQSPYTMHHFNSQKTINIYEIIRKTEVGKELMKKVINYDDAFLHFDTNTTVINCTEQYLTVNDKENPKADIIHNWLHHKDGLFAIKSPMGTAKSTIINYIIEESHSMDLRVLVITNRRSVASDFSKKYGMKLYSRDIYNSGDSLIVQYDSLWKYNIKEFDIVIMDEFISLMIHARSNLNNSSLNIAKFFGAFNKKLVIADAFLTGYENFLLSNKTSNIVQLNNTWRDTTTLLSYNCKNTFTNNLLYTSKEHKITVSSTSLAFLNSIRDILERRGKKVVMLTADTPDSTKELIYGLFEKTEHDKWDAFLYSPTLTVGVSNLNNNRYHFHYDSSMSTDVISSIQMMKRTRKAKEIHMFISERLNYLKTTYNSIRDDYMQNIGRNIDQNYLFDIDDYGETKLSQIGRNAIKIDTFKNILEFNHKEGMLWLLKYHFGYEPRVITQVSEGGILTGATKRIKLNKDLSLDSNINMFLSLSEIEKTDILMGNDSDKIIRTLAEIDDHISSEIDNELRNKLLRIALENKGFIQQCLYYKDTLNFSLGILDLNNIKTKVSKAVISNNLDQLNFYNSLIKLNAVAISEKYSTKEINNDKPLKWILEQCGYKVRSDLGTLTKDISLMSQSEKNDILTQSIRIFGIDKNVKDYYGYIRS